MVGLKMVDEINKTIEERVLDWYQDYWGVPVFPSFKKIKIAEDTSLSTGKDRLLWEDAEDLLVEYFTIFNVEKKGFSFIKYWPNEEVFMPLNFLRGKGEKLKFTEPEVLTVKMLMESARAGYWLYE